MRVALEKKPYVDKDRVIDILTSRKNGGKKGLDWALGDIKLKEPNNIKVVNDFIKNESRVDEKVIKILLNNGLDINKIEKNFEVRLKKGQDKKEAMNILDKLLMTEVDGTRRIIGKDIKKVDIIPIGEMYKIILRDENGKASLRYECDMKRNGYEFNKIYKKDRSWLLKIIKKVPKMIKHTYRYMTMESSTYKDLQQQNKIKHSDIQQERSHNERSADGATREK